MQHLQGQRVQPLAVGQAVQPAVDAPRDGLEVARVGQGIEAVAVPEQGGDLEAGLRVGGLLGLAHQIQPEQLAVARVVGASGDLDRPAPLEAPAVAALGVAEAARQLAGRFVALLRRGGAPQLLQELQLARFMPQLRQEGGDPLQVGVDPVRLHGAVERIEALRPAARGCVAHDLRELQVG